MASYDLDIIDFNEDGEGIGKEDGFTWFVRGAVIGDHVNYLPLKRKKHYGFATIDTLVKASKDRVKPPCSVFERCGGCALQHYDYDAQLAFKTRLVENALMRIGSFQSIQVNPIIGMKEPFRFRNKAVYQLSQNGKLGLYERGSHRVVPVDDCLVQDERHAQMIKAFRGYLEAFGVSIYHETQRAGMVKHLVIRRSDATRELMVTVVTSKAKLPMTKKLAEMLVEACPEVTSVHQSIQPEHTSKILGDTVKCLYGKAHLVDQIGSLSFQISPLSFFQVNSAQAYHLYQAALEAADLKGTETVFDFYCGTGTLTLFLAQRAKSVYGIELNGAALEDARINASHNQINHAQFIVGSVEEAAPALMEKGVMADVIVLDPPRSGCTAEVLDTLLQMAPRTIVYVSCKPSTLARDLKTLCADGTYHVAYAQPVDMFGHTTGVETVVKLVRG